MGQMLFCESATCIHGSRHRFSDKYYASILMHFQPVDTDIWNWQQDVSSCVLYCDVLVGFCTVFDNYIIY